ncbi:MAG: hypothetical protein C4320_00010 [Armatimonadota bacterium]
MGNFWSNLRLPPCSGAFPDSSDPPGRGIMLRWTPLPPIPIRKPSKKTMSRTLAEEAVAQNPEAADYVRQLESGTLPDAEEADEETEAS